MVEEAYAVMTRLGNKDKDHCDVVGENVACHLREIKDPKLQMVAKHRINQVLFEIAMSEFEPSPSSRSASTELQPLYSPSPSGSSMSQPNSPMFYTQL